MDNPQKGRPLPWVDAEQEERAVELSRLKAILDKALVQRAAGNEDAADKLFDLLDWELTDSGA